MGPEIPDAVRFPLPWGMRFRDQVGLWLARLSPQVVLEPPVEKSAYRIFLEELTAAVAEPEVLVAGRFYQSALEVGNWKAQQAFLERYKPERWARRDRMELTGKGGGPMEIRVDVSSEGPAIDVTPGTVDNDEEILLEGDVEEVEL